MKLAILGFGKEGKSLLKFLKKSPKYRNAKIEIRDQKKGKNYLRGIERFDVAFRSPGVPYSLPRLVRARRDGLRISSATILFFEEARKKIPNRIIGITGSKGKSTTATLIYNILSASGGKAAKKNVFLVGNVGNPALNILPKLKKNSWVVLELSSFQLHDLPHSPHIAAVLDVFPEHLDHHGSVREYYGAKTNIVRWQKSSDFSFFFSDNLESRRIATRGKGGKMPVGTKNFELFSPDDLKIKGEHNFRNAVMAAVVSKKLGVPEKTIMKVIKNFRGLEHRLEFVRRIKHIEFYNDSASTNPHTTAAALLAFPKQSVILIAGGQDKGLAYEVMKRAVITQKPLLVVLIGENKKKIQGAVKKTSVPIQLATNLKTAVRVAYQHAKSLPRRQAGHLLNSSAKGGSASGGKSSTILFSPGSASFDMFEHYADRGTQFKKIVKQL